MREAIWSWASLREETTRDRRGGSTSSSHRVRSDAPYTYDGLGRVLTERNALNQTHVIQYDDALRRTVVTSAHGLTTTTVQDAAGRTVSVLQSAQAAGTLGATRYIYDDDPRDEV